VDWLQTTLVIYGRAVSKGARLAVRNWPMFAALFVYGAILNATVALAVLLGPIGGIVIYLVSALCFGSFLASVEAIVRSGKATLNDFRRSFGMYFSDVIGVMFAQWIFVMILNMLAAVPNGAAIAAFATLAAWVFFNAVPELIYLGHYSTMEMLGESYSFIAQNWIEWFPINVALGFAMIALWDLLPDGGVLWTALRMAVMGVFVYFTMVVRGLLFVELAGSSRRGRIFRHRASG